MLVIIGYKLYVTLVLSVCYKFHVLTWKDIGQQGDRKAEDRHQHVRYRHIDEEKIGRRVQASIPGHHRDDAKVSQQRQEEDDPVDDAEDDDEVDGLFDVRLVVGVWLVVAVVVAVVHVGVGRRRVVEVPEHAGGHRDADVGGGHGVAGVAAGVGVDGVDQWGVGDVKSRR